MRDAEREHLFHVSDIRARDSPSNTRCADATLCVERVGGFRETGEIDMRTPYIFDTHRPLYTYFAHTHTRERERETERERERERLFGEEVCVVLVFQKWKASFETECLCS